jgi:hypothetical protein
MAAVGKSVRRLLRRLRELSVSFTPLNASAFAL